MHYRIDDRVVLLLQELSKITMPIVFNEPLSFLQRISEYMEHTNLICNACAKSDSIARMQVDTSIHTDALEDRVSMKCFRAMCCSNLLTVYQS